MKLRIQGNSVRLRVNQKDLSQLLQSGRVEEGMRFGSDPRQLFSYALEIDDSLQEGPEVDYHSGHFAIRMSREQANSWEQTSAVSFAATREIQGASLRVLIEKDFACLDRAPGRENEDAHAFPNPSAACQPAAAIEE